MSPTNVSPGGDEGGHRYYSAELLPWRGAAGTHSKQHDVCCLLFLLQHFLIPAAGDLWRDKCLKLFIYCFTILFSFFWREGIIIWIYLPWQVGLPDLLCFGLHLVLLSFCSSFQPLVPIVFQFFFYLCVSVLGTVAMGIQAIALLYSIYSFIHWWLLFILLRCSKGRWP